MAPQPAKFSGSFFTAEPIALNRQVRLFVEAAKAAATVSDQAPIAIVSPHAGYRYSGAIAGQAFAAARDHRYRRIVILSPSHRYAFDGLAMPSWTQMQLPNGVVTVDKLLRNDLRDRRLIRVEDAAHEHEHGIETQLPFVARYFRGARIVPIVCGNAPVAEVARLIDDLAAPDTLFVVSSDLSHFQTQSQAQMADAQSARMIETGDLSGLGGDNACGWRVLAGFLASQTGAFARMVRLAMGDSAKASGDADRVVGYGAWACYRSNVAAFGDTYRRELLGVARKVVRSRLQKGRMPIVRVPSFRTPLQTHIASFVTLTRDGQLRGCIGSLTAQRPLITDIAENAVKAAVADTRFRALADPAQLDDIRFKIALLSKPKPLSVTGRADFESRLVPKTMGVILQDGDHRGTFLPMVWDSLRDPAAFAAGLMMKAGLPKDHWSDNVRIWTFEAENFEEAQ
ncbi:MAG: AmmeMemoRadiSam system protein B [Pseudomonadota bacterium]